MHRGLWPSTKYYIQYEKVPSHHTILTWQNILVSVLGLVLWSSSLTTTIQMFTLHLLKKLHPTHTETLSITYMTVHWKSSPQTPPKIQPSRTHPDFVSVTQWLELWCSRARRLWRGRGVWGEWLPPQSLPWGSSCNDLSAHSGRDSWAPRRHQTCRPCF